MHDNIHTHITIMYIYTQCICTQKKINRYTYIHTTAIYNTAVTKKDLKGGSAIFPLFFLSKETKLSPKS